MDVMAPRENWSDQRLDDLNEKVGAGFVRVERRIEAVETKVGELGKKVGELDEKVGELDKKVEVLGTRVDGLEKKVDEGFARLEKDNRQLRTEMLGFTGAIIATVIGAGAFF